MINIAICDSNKVTCSYIEDILLNYANSTFLRFEISVFYSGEKLLDYLRQENTLHIIFLDLHLRGGEIREIGKKLKNAIKNYRIEIVLLCDRKEFHRSLLPVLPLQCIYKPIIESEVVNVLRVLIAKMQDGGGVFSYQKNQTIYRIPNSDIIYFESQNRKVKIVTTKETDFFYSRIQDVYTKVIDHQFCQIHRSYIVNINHVIIFRDTEVIMANREILVLSRNRKNRVRELLNNEIGKARIVL